MVNKIQFNWDNQFKGLNILIDNLLLASGTLEFEYIFSINDLFEHYGFWPEIKYISDSINFTDL